MDCTAETVTQEWGWGRGVGVGAKMRKETTVAKQTKIGVAKSEEAAASSKQQTARSSR